MSGALPDYAPLNLPQRFPRITHVEGTVAFAASTTSNPLRIDQSGLLLGLLLTFKGTLTTIAGTTTAGNTAPYSIIQRVTLSAGGGLGKTVDVSAYELNVAERTREQDYVDDALAPTTASTANAWTFALFVPTCVRDGDLYSEWTDLTGALYTGDPQISITLTLTFGAVANALSTVNSATLTGTITVTSYKLDVPTPDRVPQLLGAISWSHVLIEERLDAGANQMPYQMPTNEPRVYLRIWNLYSEGASGTSLAYKNGIITAWDLNLQDYIHFFDSVPEQVLLEQQLRRYATALPAGSYVADFAAAMYRTQWMPVDKVTLFKNNPTVTGPGANPNINVVQESLVPSPLARKWIAQAAAQGIAPAAA